MHRGGELVLGMQNSLNFDPQIRQSQTLDFELPLVPLSVLRSNSPSPQLPGSIQFCKGTPEWVANNMKEVAQRVYPGHRSTGTDVQE